MGGRIMRDVTTLTPGEELGIDYPNGSHSWGRFEAFHDGFVIAEVHRVSMKFPLSGTRVTVTDSSGRVVGLPDSDPPIVGEPPDLE